MTFDEIFWCDASHNICTFDHLKKRKSLHIFSFNLFLFNYQQMTIKKYYDRQYFNIIIQRVVKLDKYHFGRSGRILAEAATTLACILVLIWARWRVIFAVVRWCVTHFKKTCFLLLFGIKLQWCYLIDYDKVFDLDRRLQPKFIFLKKTVEIRKRHMKKQSLCSHCCHCSNWTSLHENT